MIILALWIHFFGFSSERSISISFGPVKVGEDRLKLQLSDFKIIQEKSNPNVSATFVDNSVQWVRNETSNLLIPRARMAIRVKNESNILIHFLDQQIIPQGEQEKYAELYVNLFNPGEIVLHNGDKKVEKISVETNRFAAKGAGHLIDYSCSRFAIEFDGLDDEYLSAGCRVEPVGTIGEEAPRLTLTWSTTHLRPLGGEDPPYRVIFHQSGTSTLTMIDRHHKHHQVVIKAKLSERYHRLKTAIGIGPYSYRSQEANKLHRSSIAPTGMIYTKWDITSTTSLRGFDALILKNGSIFNNAGIYFAYELADAFDGRIQLIPLLGLQALSFRFDSDSDSSHRIIYPQGFELVYNHAFGLENMTMTYGMFISTQGQETYDNLWFRVGRKIFGEINYIRWGHGDRLAQTWGLSIGLPFMSFF